MLRLGVPDRKRLFNDLESVHRRGEECKHARQIAYLRGLIKVGKKDEADACKKRLPLYVAGGVMEGGRKLEHMVRYSACMVIDIDDSPIPVFELLRRAAALPYVKAGHVSPSGTGVKLFILVDSGLKDRGESGHPRERPEPGLFRRP